MIWYKHRMKRTGWALAAACAIGCGSAPAEQTGARPAVAPAATAAAPEARPAAMAAPAGALAVDRAFAAMCGDDAIPLEVAGSRHFVKVRLKGPKAEEELRFHVDTGGNTPGLGLRKAAAERLGFASAHALPRTLAIGGRDVALPEKTAWNIFDAPRDAARKDFEQGQIGAGFLAHFVVCIDPAAGRLGLARPDEVAIDPASAPWIPLSLIAGGDSGAQYPFVFVRVGGGGYGMLLDTGATSSMLEASPMKWLAGKHEAWPTAAGAAGDADMIAGAWPEKVLRADEATISFPTAGLHALGLEQAPAHALGPVVFVERPDGTFEGMFGTPRYMAGASGAIANDVLDRFRLLIDYKNARLWLQPTERPPDASSSWSRVGLSLEFGADGCPAVRQVTSSNPKPVHRALRAGDVLVEIDGKGVCGAWHHEIAALLAGPPGSTRKVTARRRGKRLRLELPVTDLLPYKQASSADR